MCYIVFIPRIKRPLRPASVFSMMMMMMMISNVKLSTVKYAELLVAISVQASQEFTK